jgi:hypothetical protein
MLIGELEGMQQEAEDEDSWLLSVNKRPITSRAKVGNP